MRDTAFRFLHFPAVRHGARTLLTPLKWRRRPSDCTWEDVVAFGEGVPDDIETVVAGVPVAVPSPG